MMRGISAVARSWIRLPLAAVKVDPTDLLIVGILACGCSAETAVPTASEPSGVQRMPLGSPRGDGVFRPRGVGGGGALYSPSINPHRPWEILMASDMSGVYHTNSYGLHWEILPFPTLEGGPLSQFRFTLDPSVVYAVNSRVPPLGASRLVKSRDGGLTWTAPITTPGEPGKPYYLFVDDQSTQRLLFSDKRHVFFSDDGGRTFSLVYESSLEKGLVVGGAHFDGRDIYVATSEGILVSHGGGRTFRLDAALGAGIPPGESIVSFAAARRGHTTRFFAVTFKNRDSHGAVTVFAGITGGNVDQFGGLYRMTLGNASWERTAPDLTGDEKLSFVTMSERWPDIAYAAGGFRGGADTDILAASSPIVLKTEDGGTTWKHVFLTKGNANIATGWSGYHGDMGWDWGEYALGLAVSRSDPRRAVLTDLGFVHVTDDGGRHWRQAYVDADDANRPGQDTPKGRSYHTSGVEQTSGWWLTWPGRNTLFASVTDIRSAYSLDGGESWVRDNQNGISYNTTYHVVKHPQTGLLYAATSTVHDLYQSPYLRDSTIDGSSHRGAVLFSSTQGASFSMLYDFQHPVVWLALDPNQPNQLYASVVNSLVGGVYRMNLDRPSEAPSALPAPPRTKGHPYNVHVLRDGSIVASYSGHQDGDSRTFTDRSGVFLLPPGASGWEDRSAPEMHYLTKDVVVDPGDESRWYAAVFTHEDATAFGGLYRTTDRGRHWRRISDRYRVESCAIDPRHSRRMYLTTQGEGLWWTEDVEQEWPEFRRLNDYPFEQPMRVFWNPFDHDEMWTVSFGGGIRVRRERGQ